MEFNDFLLSNEKPIRMFFFFGMLAGMALWEVLAPRRALTVSRTLRWSNNLGLVFFNSIMLRLVFPAAAVGMAAFAAEQGWGVFNSFSVPLWLAVLLSLVAMDFIIYLQHVLVHRVSLLWRLHRVHHADLDYDVTTGARFHPLEILLSMLIKFATIALLGAPLVAVIVFEVVLNAMAMFNHANVRLPLGLDRLLRNLAVTPDMHRVHHSVEMDEANSNFGFNLSIWDRLFGTYRDQPRNGHEGMSIGIHHYRAQHEVCRIDKLILLPFRNKIGDDAAVEQRQENE